MAQTFTLYYPGIAFAAGKNMAAIINTHASEVLKVRRVGLLNTQTAAVTGVICQLDLQYRPSAGLTGHTTISPVAHDSTNSAPASAIYGHAGTPTGTAYTLRRVFWSSDEPAISAATLDELECLVPFNIIWDAGYGDSNVQPLTLRQNDGMFLYNQTGAAGIVDIWIEFTKE